MMTNISGYVECKCKTCGNLFYKPPSQVMQGAGKYCSLKCYHRSVRCICWTCGSIFSVSPSRVKKGVKYCSKQCHNDGMRNQVKRVCIICKKEFLTHPSNLNYGKRGMCCSRECASQANKGSNNPMWRGGSSQHQYRGANWNKQKKLAYSRDGGICQYCGYYPKNGDPKNSIHHIKPFRKFESHLEANALTNLITLCRRCHILAEHGKIILQPKLL